jgi:hypothetical protein
MIPAHIRHHFPRGLFADLHPRMLTLEMLNYIRYLAEPRPGTFTQEAWQHEMERIRGTACAAIEFMGSEPGKPGSPEF